MPWAFPCLPLVFDDILPYWIVVLRLVCTIRSWILQVREIYPNLYLSPSQWTLLPNPVKPTPKRTFHLLYHTPTLVSNPIFHFILLCTSSFPPTSCNTSFYSLCEWYRGGSVKHCPQGRSIFALQNDTSFKWKPSGNTFFRSSFYTPNNVSPYEPPSCFFLLSLPFSHTIWPTLLLSPSHWPTYPLFHHPFLQ